MADTIAYLEAIIGADVTSFRRGMQEVRRSLFDIGGLGESLRGVGTAMTMALTVPLIAAGGAALKLRADFDQAMRNVNSMALLGEDQFQSLSAAVLEFGSTIRSGPIGAAEALYTVIGAGWSDVTEAMQISQIAARTAEAGLADMTTTTEGLVAALLSYGAGVDQAAQYSDILTRMVQVGVGTMNEFGGSLSYVLPAAAALNVPFQDVAATLAYLTQRGFSASRASTSLNNAFSKLIQPSAAMSALFEEMGVSSGRELIATMGGLQGALNAIFEATNGNEQALAALFPDERGRRAILLAATDLENFNSVFDEFEANMNGATMAAWEEQSKSLAFQFDLLTAAIQGFAIKVGAELEPILLPIVVSLRELFVAASNLPPELIQMGIAFGAVLAAAGPVLWVIGALITPTGILAATIAALGVAWAIDAGGFRTQITNLWNTVSKNATPIVDALRPVIDILLELASAVITPFSGVIDFVINPDPSIDNPQEFMTRLGHEIEWAITQAVSNFQTLAPQIGKELQWLLTQVVTWLQSKGIPAASELATAVGSWLVETLPLIAKEAGKFAATLLNLIAGAINWVVTTITSGSSGGIDASAISDYISGDIIGSFLAGFNEIGNQNQGTLGGELFNLSADAVNVLGVVFSTLTGAVGGLVEGFSKLGPYVKIVFNAFEDIVNALNAKGVPLDVTLSNIGVALQQIGGAIISGGWTLFKSTVMGAATALGELLGIDIAARMADWDNTLKLMNLALALSLAKIVSSFETGFAEIVLRMERGTLNLAEKANELLSTLGLPTIDLAPLQANIAEIEFHVVDTAFANAIEQAILTANILGEPLDVTQLLSVTVDGQTLTSDLLSALTAPGVYNQLTESAKAGLQTVLDSALASGDLETYINLADILIFNSVDDDFRIDYSVLNSFKENAQKLFTDNPININPKLASGDNEDGASLLTEFQTLFSEGSELRLLITGFGDFYALEMADLTLQTSNNTIKIVEQFTILKGSVVTALDTAKAALMKMPQLIIDSLGAAAKNVRAYAGPIISELDRIAAAANAVAAAIASIGSVQVPGVNVGVGAGGNVRAYANGGSFAANMPMLVGENGPELIVPRTSGMVVPNGMSVNRNGGGAGGGSVYQTNNVYITARDTDQLIDELERRGIYLTRSTI